MLPYALGREKISFTNINIVHYFIVKLDSSYLSCQPWITVDYKSAYETGVNAMTTKFVEQKVTQTRAKSPFRACAYGKSCVLLVSNNRNDSIFLIDF